MSTPLVGVTAFPGSTCQEDVAHVLGEVLGFRVQWLWHTDASCCDHLDALVIPGGFTFGDYLRAGALAARSPVMEAVTRFAHGGGPVLGICNGFQILLESGLLPGALTTNLCGQFIHRTQPLVCTSTRSFWTRHLTPGQPLTLEVAHKHGRFIAPQGLLEDLQAGGQVTLVYPEAENPNGSMGAVAGVCNQAGNVMGLMPHPERACEPVLGGSSGLLILGAIGQG